jgi:VanZ family protein
MFSIPHQVFSAEEDRLWETHIAFFPVPAGAADARFYLQNLGYAGTLRVDDISITPAQARAGTPWWKAFFGLLWFTAAGFSLTVLKLWKRRLGWAICVTVVLILIGALLPGEVLDGGIEQTGQTIQRLSEKLLPPEPAAVAPAGKPAPPKPSAPKEEKPPLFTGEEAFDNAHFIGHFTLFSLLALLTAISWFSGKPPLRLAAAVFTGLTLFACATEVLQFITPDRSASLYDVRTDLAGMAIVILLIFAAVHIRRIVFAAKNKPCPSP